MKLVRHTTPTTSRPTDWLDAGACRDLNDDTFYPPPGDTAATADAKAICATCPVIEPCLQAALDEEGNHGASNRYGIRGGQTRSQRRHAYEKGLTAAQVLERQRLPTTPTADELRDLYAKHTEPTADGHVIWTGAYPVIGIRDTRLTVGKLAFQFGHGRPPEGLAKRSCDRDQCVAPGCLTDRKIREQLKTAA